MADEIVRDEMPHVTPGTRLYPVAEALRAIYDADNHDSLDGETLGLMIDLSKVPFEPCAIDAVPTAPPAIAEPVPVPRSLFARMKDMLHR